MKDNSHKTAITRKELSRPIRDFREHVKGRVLDFGCGKGSDADILGADKYDPHFFPEKPKGLYDTVLCTYVLNTTFFPKDVLKRVCEYVKPGGTIIVSTRSITEVNKAAKKGNWAEYRGGYLTGKKTFQRGLSVASLIDMFSEEFTVRHTEQSPYTLIIAERLV